MGGEGGVGGEMGNKGVSLVFWRDSRVCNGSGFFLIDIFERRRF